MLVTHSAYDAAGNAYEITDPRNILTEYYFDMLGRMTGKLENSDGGSPATGSASTGYTYDGDDNVLTMTANLVSPVQTTAYVRGVGGTSGTNLFSNDLIAKIEYPIETGTSAGQPDTTSSGSVSYSYDLLGEPLTAIDRNGSVHTYTYDILGRLKLDAVTALGAGVDGSVRALGYSYTALGLPYQQTSYSNSGATTVVNQVQDVYNGYGQLTTQYQEHSGSVSTSTSLKVQYSFSQPSGANYSRLSSMIYPNGRVEDYVYNSGLDSDISRVSGISDDAGTGAGSVESYKYLGLDTIVQRTDGNGIALTYVKQSGESNGDAGDQYIGLDRFGRVVDQRWIPTSSPSSPTDRLQYGYDRDGNVLTKNDLVNSSFSELYHSNSSVSGDNATAYDKLNRLTGFRRGTLSASGNNGSGVLDTVSTLNTLSNSQQSFTLDAVGNQTSVTTDGTATSRTVNSQNQLTAVGSTSLAFDNNGNTNTDDQGHTLVYDAWNRLVKVKNGSTTLTTYTFDVNDWRISEHPGTATDIYFSSAGQVIEERQSTTVTNQYVWGLGYVNDLLLRDDNSSSGSYGKSSSGLGQRLYLQQDANYNVTAVTDVSGNVKERFIYSPYGVMTVLGPTWSSTSDAYAWRYTFEGGRWDSVTGMIRFGLRDFRAATGTWVEQDPTGPAYIDGANLYAMTRSNPIIRTDPTGLGDEDWYKYVSDVSQLWTYYAYNRGYGNFEFAGTLLKEIAGRLGISTSEALAQMPEGLLSGGAEGAGGFVSSEMMGAMGMGALAGVAAYLAMQNAIQYYENQAAEGDFYNQQGNMASISDYWHRQMEGWGQDFLDNYTKTPCGADPARVKQAQNDFRRRLSNLAGALAMDMYAHHQRTPRNAGAMMAMIFQRYGKQAFAAYDDDIKRATDSSKCPCQKSGGK